MISNQFRREPGLGQLLYLQEVHITPVMEIGYYFHWRSNDTNDKRSMDLIPKTASCEGLRLDYETSPNISQQGNFDTPEQSEAWSRWMSGTIRSRSGPHDSVGLYIFRKLDKASRQAIPHCDHF